MTPRGMIHTLALAAAGVAIVGAAATTTDTLAATPGGVVTVAADAPTHAMADHSRAGESAATGAEGAWRQAGHRPAPAPATGSTGRASTGQAHAEDEPGWRCAEQGNRVCGTGVDGGPDPVTDECPAGGVRVYGTPHGCRYGD